MPDNSNFRSPAVTPILSFSSNWYHENHQFHKFNTILITSRKQIIKKKTKTKPKTTKPSTERKRSKKTKSFEAKSQKVKAWQCLEYVDARLVVYQQNENMFKEDIKLLKLDVMLRDNALAELRKKFEKAEQDRDDIVFNCDELISSESDVSMPTSPVHERPSVKPVENPTSADNLRKDIPKTKENGLKACKEPCNKGNSLALCKDDTSHVVPTTVLTSSRLVPLNVASLVTTDVPKTKVQHHKPTKHGVNKAYSPIRRPINLRPSPRNSNFHQKVTTIKANQIQVSYGLGPQKTLTFLFDVQENPQHALEDKGVIDSGCSRHMTANISYLSHFKEIYGGYVAFGGNPKGGKITGKDTECIVLSSDFKLSDENHVLLRVPRENNMYNVDLKNIVPSGQDVEDAAENEDAVNEVFDEPTLPSPTLATTPPPPQPEHIPSSPQAKIAQLLPPPQPQSSQPTKISMTLLNQLMETCATMTKQVANLEQDKLILLWMIRRMHPNKGKNVELDVDEDVTLEEVDAKVTMDANVQGRLEESQAKVYHLDLEHADKVLSMQETDEAEPVELMTEVVATAATTITAAIVPKASALRRRRGVIIQDPEEVDTALKIMQSEVKSKDKGKGILVKEPKPLKRQAQIEQDEAFAREMEAGLNTNINWNNVVDQVKRKERQDNTVMRYQALKRKPVIEAQTRKNMMHYNSIQAFLEKGEKEIEEEESKRKSKNLEQRVAKKQKIDEETKELKTHLQIIPNDEDDVYTEATPLALKVPIVNYQIHHEHNKPLYKIIRADGTHQLFLSVITLLRNFDREDLEMLAKRAAWNEFSCSMASAIICLATVDDLSSHTTIYTSHALTQKVFANMRRVGKGFSRVKTSLFASMLVQPQPQVAEEEDDVEVPAAPTLPSPTPPLQDAIPTPPQAQPAILPSPLQEQPTCATLSQKVTQLEQDKITQALEILKLKKRVKKLEKKRRSKSSGGGKIEAIDANVDITLVDIETQVDLGSTLIKMKAEKQDSLMNRWLKGSELQGRKDDDNAASKDINAVEPTVFDDEEVTVKRKYPLTRFTLEQMLNNVRLEVEEQSEMSLELLRLVRRQHQEGYKLE
nr:hypothetical protein [Tanacetum cinerariifolium]